MNKFLRLITIMMVIAFAVPVSAFAEENNSEEENNGLALAPDAKSAILLEQDTGEILFDKNAHEKLPPASMTKIMTLLLIMEALDKGNLQKDEMIRVSERAASMGGSQIFLEAGEEMSVNDLLKGVAIASGNDASVALAERLAGSEEAFVKKMNERAKELKLENTHFQNSTGLPADNHYSTSYDMAMIANELLKYEAITDYTSVYEDYLRKGQDNEFWLVNTNKLVRFYPDVDGLKTGYTSEAKYCLTATAKRDDMRVIAVVMGAESPKERNTMVSGLLDYAFNQFETNKLFDRDEKITDIHLLKSKQKNVDIVTKQSISTLHKKGEEEKDIQTEVKLQDTWNLPVKRGDEVGKLYVKDGEQVLYEIPLTVEEDIEKTTYFSLLKRTVQEMVKSR
ncbi:D-alanyl-D-alanine carboxypeptidase family protein [Oceanobacillus profundus]|uniref:serine-type D-Ala-D-Ala carboxypeptidase n=2 Tax=Bacillaceae TaxID=186817 RepID=A0A417YG40_9BACI|nr:D-alanyl-D-alanine carboxypeptidase family protein [Oceanobacillus profundus]MBR3120724.1 D-alanyl-D-alanine carboxypeptidase [Oceanobacillus sp.]PAE29873.1 D-alanyl-D-alanine carboxypeptidase [Paenibacillus sp. 7884-2]MCM3396570.1 D-alanyl-D-alanine carboxypeptidase [Oceanobacillus profundus]MDO6451087.1 D-alanyl-D-alanine carboxypeptidase family protein [Oceanobacillus profundus]RHW31718.1 D-alanyl-D-alanine carboxypeptidase [Oceanobacillus profundus]